jgi:hypothetical protein
MTIEDVYSRLRTIKNNTDSKKDEAFESKKAFKYMYSAMLDLLDNLDYLKENDELLDDDWDTKFFYDNDEEVMSEEIAEEKEKSVIDIDDLI